ncbi:hypothetical protein JYU34_014470 [Plutella xylostella]|uniref:Major facilitator superfamily (MFS) profile domain-containing protein n=1 Tax=Plutella xylostella TaxID=51655 RepID=A0ABQ7Q9E6_PLUXY|nr:hypothetical protein JYU34_014470 [Plutella xylostella]
MTQNEDRLTESNDRINTISELPGRPFRLTMEVPLFTIMLAFALSGSVISNVVLYRICVHSLHHSEDECRPFLAPVKSNTSRQLEEEVQKYSTTVSLVRTLVESTGPAVLSLFIGVWSDTYGRKPLVVWPLFGSALSAMLNVVFALAEGFGPWWYVLTAVPFSLTGGYTALFTGAFTYISDITTNENRSLRMTVLEAVFSAGSLIGSLASSYVINLVGNLVVLLINAALIVVAYVFTAVFVTESLNGALPGNLMTLLDIRLVKEMIDTCFKQRPNRGRAQLLLLTLTNSFSIFVLYGLMSLSYIYTREKLHWAVKEYSIYSAANTLINVIGAVAGVKFGKMIGLGDLPLAILGHLSAVGDLLVVAFAVTSWQMYMGAGIAMFKGMAAPLVRSFITKVMPLEDIAKAFALLCAFEAICPLISSVVYNSLYRYTIVSFPGAIYVFSAFILFVCAVMLAVVQYFTVKGSTPYQRVEEDVPVDQDN